MTDTNQWLTLVLCLLCGDVLTEADGDRYPAECALTLEASNRIDGRARCIGFDDIDEAFHVARQRAGLHTPIRARDVTDTALGLLGTALQETTRILAERFSLSGDEIESALPRVDTSTTDIANFCPVYLRLPRQCHPTRYRRHDGSCNNLDEPTWGAARTPFRKVLRPEYADGISSPRVGTDGFPLPPPRVVSSRIHRDFFQGHEQSISFMFVAFGQLIDHDLTLTAETKVPGTRRDPDCCSGGPRHPNCFPLLVPSDDPFYKRHHQSCINMIRSEAGVRPGCRLGYRVQINALTSHLDANFVYGSSFRVSDSLRLLRDGRMKTVPLFDHFNLKPLLPPKIEDPDDGCIRPHPDLFCFLAGDNRVNEQLALGVLHTMFVREHNRIASELGKVNPHWDDETLYQETRHIVAALVQHITYSEFLPLLLGDNTMNKFGLSLRDKGYSDDYDPDVDASVSAEFGTAAFRFGHSLLPHAMERWSNTHQYIGERRLSAVLQQPFDLHKPGWYDQYMLGMINQLSQAMDDSVTKEVTNHLFQEPTREYGRDLASINVGRAREHGVPGYTRYRRLCGLPTMDSWSEMMHHMSNYTVSKYFDIFSHPDDVDLWSAGIAERSAPGSMVGPTFRCLIAMTFRDLKIGDRFWYENGGWPSSFSPEQLDEIRKIKLARIVCNSGDDMDTVQVKVMQLPHYIKNPRVPCSSQVLPNINFWKWKEFTEYSTEATYNKETIVEETDNYNSEGEDEEEYGPSKETDPDYHVITVDNKPVLIKGYDGIIDSLTNDKTDPYIETIDEESIHS